MYPTNHLKNQNFEKMKEAAWHIINLHLCTTKNNQMYIWLLRYAVWQTEFCHFGLFFALLRPPLTTKKIKIQNKKKKKVKKITGDIITLHMCTIHEDHTMSGSWDIDCNRPEFFTLSPNKPENQNFEKWKKHLVY